MKNINLFQLTRLSILLLMFTKVEGKSVGGIAFENDAQNTLHEVLPVVAFVRNAAHYHLFYN